jgi:hypothetical protein
MRVNRDALFGLFLLAVAMFFVVGSLDYDPLARQIPLFVGIPVAVLLVVQVLSQLFPGSFAWLERSEGREVIHVDEKLLAQAEAIRAPTVQRGSALEFQAWIGGFVLAIYLAGFLVAIPIFLLGLLHLRLKEKLAVSVMAAVVMWLVAYVGFIKLMEVPLFSGVLLG